MDIRLGTLEIVPSADRPELMAPSTADILSSLQEEFEVGAAGIDPVYSDTAAFCQHYNVKTDRVANCVVLEAKRADRTWYAACVILGSTRADVNGLARRTLDARRVSFAPMDMAVEATGMEYGAITPVGLPDGWTILVDKTVADSDFVIIGSGIRNSKLIVPGALIAQLPHVRVLDGLGRI